MDSMCLIQMSQNEDVDILWSVVTTTAQVGWTHWIETSLGRHDKIKLGNRRFPSAAPTLSLQLAGDSHTGHSN